MAGACVLLWAVAGFLGTSKCFDPEQEKCGFYLTLVSPQKTQHVTAPRRMLPKSNLQKLVTHISLLLTFLLEVFV